MTREIENFFKNYLKPVYDYLEFIQMDFIHPSLEKNFWTMSSCPLILKPHPQRLHGTNFLFLYTSLIIMHLQKKNPMKLLTSVKAWKFLSAAHQVQMVDYCRTTKGKKRGKKKKKMEKHRLHAYFQNEQGEGRSKLQTFTVILYII